jgi:hypothetical protein
MIPDVEFLDFNNERIPVVVTLSVISKANIDFKEKYDKDLLQIILTDKPGAYYIEALTFLLKHAIIVGCERANVKLKKEWEKTDMLIDDYDIFLKFVEITVKSLTALTETNNDKKTTEKKMKSKM